MTGSGKQDVSAKKTLSDFADAASLTGPANIKNASKFIPRITWIIIFSSVTLAWLLHSYWIIRLYLNFDTTSSVAIIYKPAPFPSVTLCNINPVKMSTIPTFGTPELADFLEDISPRLNYVHELSEKLNNQTNSNSSTTSAPPAPGRRKLLHFENYFYSDYVEQADFYAGNTGLVNWGQLANEADDYSVYLANPNSAPYSKATIAFHELISDVPDLNRTQMGHMLVDMMLYCSYDGKHCSAHNFTRYLDINYGNCWTFNSATTHPSSLMSKRSGSKYGLDLILYIDDPEYIQGLQLGRGIRYHVHPHKTMPFVNDIGMSVPPGQQAFASLRLVNQTRLGGKYGACDDTNGEYVKYYNNQYIYTLQACEHTCLDRIISRRCGCYRKTQKQYYNTQDLNRLSVCRNGSGLECVYTTQAEYDRGLINCGCNQACHTLDYQILPSNDLWPDSSLWYGLVDAVCVREPKDCQDFKNVSFGDRVSVLSLHASGVLVKSTWVMPIKDKRQGSQFASDIGGTVGLWIGATAVTVMEIIELCLRLCSVFAKEYIYKRKKNHESELFNRQLQVRNSTEELRQRNGDANRDRSNQSKQTILQISKAANQNGSRI